MRVGVDLGGTKIQAVALDGDIVVADAKRSTPSDGSRLVDAIVDCVADLDIAVDGIGIGAPGVIDRARGRIVGAPNLPIGGDLPLAALVAEAAGLDVARVALDNDVNVGTLAEHRLGAARGARDALCVFVGTGVGGGLVLDGELRRGPRGITGEIGHLIVLDGGRRCGCGGLGHLEAYAGRRSLETEARRLHEGGRKTNLVEIAGDGKMKSSVFEKAIANGDEVALELVGEAVEALGAALSSAVALVDIDVIVLGGGLADRLGPSFVDRVGTAVRNRMFVPTLELSVVPSGLGDLGGAIGAALLST